MTSLTMLGPVTTDGKLVISLSRVDVALSRRPNSVWTEAKNSATLAEATGVSRGTHQAVHVVAVSVRRRDPPGRGVRLERVPGSLESDQLGPDRSAGNGQVAGLEDGAGTDRSTRADVLLDHGAQDPSPPTVQHGRI